MDGIALGFQSEVDDKFQNRIKLSLTTSFCI